MGLYDILENAVRDHPDNLAVICGDIRYDYSRLKERVDALVCTLESLGCGKNDKIAVISKNCHRFLEIYFAAAKNGAVLVPINYRLTPSDFVYILNNAEVKVTLAQPDLIGWIEEHENELPYLERILLSGKGVPEKNSQDHESADKTLKDALDYESMIKERNESSEKSAVADSDIAQIYYTSGTTGKPKGVILTHGNNGIHAEGTISELGLNQNDRWLHVSPMFHLADSWAVWSATKVGAVHVMIPTFSPLGVFRAIQDHKVTLSNFIPTMLNIMVNHPEVGNYDFSSLRLIMSGGAPIAKEVVRKVIDIFDCDYIQTYGLTETSPFLTMSILKDDIKELAFEDRLRYMVTTGRPFFNVQLKVVREDGTEVEPDGEEVGEIIAKGDTITPAYWRLPEETAARIVDGWLYTRDLAVVNSEGYITIVDRKDDMILTGGENVYSIEVEDVLYSHLKILEAAVIGLPDPVWGEKVAAVVVLKEGEKLSEEDVISFCKAHLAHFKTPKKVFFADELPKTGSAKIYKYKLRQIYGEER